MELEQSLTPRTLWLETKGGKSNFDSLKPFAGTNVIFEFIPDAEASRAAAAIAGFVKAAGWNVVGGSAKNDLEDGVVILSAVGPPGMTTDRPAAALLDLLTSKNWQAHRFPQDPNTEPRNTITVTVGFKPSPYFYPQEMKEAMKEVQKILKKFRKPQ